MMHYEEQNASTVTLDLAKLQTTAEDQQDIFVISFLRDLERLIDRLDEEGASAHQFYVKKELFKVLTLTAPAPTRVIRNQIGRCFAQIFRKGDKKLLYETLNELLGIINTGKAEKDLRTRHVAVHTIGEIFAAAGDCAITLVTVTGSSLLKLLKYSQNHVGLRAAIFQALGKIFGVVGASADEAVMRDVWKQARNTATNDKGTIVQASALLCLEQLIQQSPHFHSMNEYEKLLSVIMKTMESSASATRHAAATCWASTLVNAHGREGISLALQSLKKMAKKPAKRSSIVQPEEDPIDSRPSSPAPGKKNAPVLSLTIEDILKQLSAQYTKPSTSPRVRAGTVQCYAEVFERLGPAVVESHYGLIANHLLVDLLSNPVITVNRFRLLTSRKHVRILLEDLIGCRLLGETAQLNAVKTLINDVIKNYPQAIKERPEPTKHTLTGALYALSSLFKSLGATLSSVQEQVRDGLLQVLHHPSYTVQIAASWTLKSFVLTVPSQLLPIITICMNSVNRELAQLTARKSLSSEYFRRCTGWANALAAVISTVPLQPLYASVDVTSRILTLATSLLKSSGDLDLRVSSTQLQVAWTLIGGLMSLGPNFVKIHLSQLLLLWKAALPKPLAKDSTMERSQLELCFLSHVRECALGSILAFLQFNARLLTTDVSKRISAMLQNSTLFLNTLPTKRHTDDISQRLSSSLQLVDYELMVRRRVLQCYNKLVKLSHGEAQQANLLTVAITYFADPDKYTPSSLSTAIASSAGNFETVWEIGDNYGYGVCDFVRKYDVGSFEFDKQAIGKTVAHWTTRSSPKAKVDEILRTPILGSLEHDSVSLYMTGISPSLNDLAPAPPATAVVNAAIDLFAILIPLQQPKVQESILEQLVSFLASKNLDRDPGRKAAITVNVAVALLGALKLTLSETIPSASLSAQPVQKAMQEILQTLLLHLDPYVRNVAYEALGRLCSIAGNSFTNNQINYLIDTIVANRDPNARAGCAVALGCIHTYVGGMAAGFHLKTIVGILMSLANDPHPAVHFWALEGLARTIDSAGLTFSGYVTSTLGILARLYAGETHNVEVASIANSNIEIELSTVNIIARCIDSLIGILGPDLQDMSKVRDLILTLIGQFLLEADPTIVMEGLRCLEHLSLFANKYVDMQSYVRRLQKELLSTEWELRDIAVDGLYQVMKGDATKILEIANPGLEDDIWFALNCSPDHEVIKNIIRNWISQTAFDDPRIWVDRCNKIMTKTVEYKQEKLIQQAPTEPSGGVDLNDEEAASFATAVTTSGEKSSSQTGAQEHLKWQVRTFAMNCLSDLLSVTGKEIQAFPEGVIEHQMIEKIGDVIKMAFSASTANVVELRLCGLRIIEQILKMFGRTPDPDFAEATLLEQYQAQISSALTPAFAADSSPELASEAVNVCAGFIATGIVKDVDRMGRILKLLVSALETFSNDSETVTVGDLKGLSSNAQVMVKMAVLSAWAELQVASTEQAYLVDVVKPHIATLAPLWLSSLREFARLRFEPDISGNVSGSSLLGGSIDTIYSALNRETLLRFYQDSWLKLVDAIASLIEQDSQFVFDALDGKESNDRDVNGKAISDDINYRDEPVAFFFVLFGLAFEALVGRPGDTLATREQTLEILLALKKILHPSVCGHAIYQEIIFSEAMDVLDRLILTEGLPVQHVIVDIVRGLCIAHPSASSKKDVRGDNLSEDIDQLFELTRIIVLVLVGILPNIVDAKTPVRRDLSEEATNLIKVSLDALVDAAEVFPSLIRMDLYASILHIFTKILGTGVCQAEVIPRSLPTFKRFIKILTISGGDTDKELVVNQVRGCLSGIITILDNAKLKAAELAIPLIKNCLATAAIVITAGTNVIPANDENIHRLCDNIIEAFKDPDTSKTALICLRSLLLSAPKSPGDQEIAKYLLPRLITYVTTNYDEDDPGNIKGVICHLFVQFMSPLPDEQVPVAMGLFIPTLLSRATKLGKKAYREIAGRLLELAGLNQLAFKQVVLGMDGKQKAFMEEVVRSGTSDEAAVVKEEREVSGPTIELKMNFG